MTEPANTSEALRKLGLLRKREAILKRRAKQATEARVVMERSLFDVLESEDGKDSSRKLEGLTYSPERTPYAVVQDKAALLKYLRENDEGLIVENLRMKELNQLVREKQDNGEPLPPGLGSWEKTWISIRGLNAQLEQEADDGEGQ